MTQCQKAGSGPWSWESHFSQTGVMAVIEEMQLRATVLSIDEINQSGWSMASNSCR